MESTPTEGQSYTKLARSTWSRSLVGIFPLLKELATVFGEPLKVGTSAPPWTLYMVRRPMTLAFSLMFMVMRSRSRVDHCTEFV